MIVDQGPRVFSKAPGGTIYVLFTNQIAAIDPQRKIMEKIADAPIGITAEGDNLDGRLYFISASHLYSFKTQ